MLRAIVVVGVAGASGGCSLLLDFSDKAIPKDAELDAPDAPYTADECAYKEPNDTLATAAPILTSDTGPAAICAGDMGEDHDFYKLNIPQGTTKAIIQISLVERPTGDLDLRLYDDASNVIAQSRGFGDTETITCPGSSPPCTALVPGAYVFEVFPAIAGAVNDYTIALTVTP